MPDPPSVCQKEYLHKVNIGTQRDRQTIYCNIMDAKSTTGFFLHYFLFSLSFPNFPLPTQILSAQGLSVVLDTNT